MRCLLPLLPLLCGSSALAQDLLVSSRLTNEVLTYDGATGAPLGTFASGGGFANPTGITFGPDNHPYTTSAFTGLIHRFHGATGEFLDAFIDDPALNLPFGLSWGVDGEPYVANQLADSVRRYLQALRLRSCELSPLVVHAIP